MEQYFYYILFLVLIPILADAFVELFKCKYFECSILSTHFPSFTYIEVDGYSTMRVQNMNRSDDVFS